MLMLQGVSKLNHGFIIRHTGNLILVYDNQVQQITKLGFTNTQICSFILGELLDILSADMVSRLSTPEAWG